MTVNITNDIIHEADESFIGALKLSGSTPVHVSIGTPSTAVGVIINDDDLGMYIYVCMFCRMHGKMLYISMYVHKHFYKFGISFQLFNSSMILAVRLNLMVRYHSQSSRWFHLMYCLLYKCAQERVIPSLLKVC